MHKTNLIMNKGKTEKKEVNSMIKGYLFLYNSVQTIGWSYLLFQIIYYYISGQFREKWLWDVTKVTALIFQNLAVLEIINVALKFVKSALALTSVQVYSRVFIVSLVLAFQPDAARTTIGNVGVTLAFTCWSITEIIRYSFYALSLINSVPYFLLWCRYTFFTFLYPLGVSGEMICVYAVQLLAAEKNLYALELPNALNITFSYRAFLILNVIGYVPGFPPLYLYMFAQRKKIIGGGSSNSSNSQKQK